MARNAPEREIGPSPCSPMVRFTLPSWPPSANNAYINVSRGKNRGRILARAARSWIGETLWQMAAQRNDTTRRLGPMKFHADSQVCLDIRLYGNWQQKNGKAKRRDLSNCVKLLEDCAAKSLGFDDCQVVRLTAEKIQAGEERSEIDVYERMEIP